eukprot:761764-Amorphochlora_amoeboformis.AAC.1
MSIILRHPCLIFRLNPLIVSKRPRRPSWVPHRVSGLESQRLHVCNHCRKWPSHVDLARPFDNVPDTSWKRSIGPKVPRSLLRALLPSLQTHPSVENPQVRENELVQRVVNYLSRLLLERYKYRLKESLGRKAKVSSFLSTTDIVRRRLTVVLKKKLGKFPPVVVATIAIGQGLTT